MSVPKDGIVRKPEDVIWVSVSFSVNSRMRHVYHYFENCYHPRHPRVPTTVAAAERAGLVPCHTCAD